MSREIPTHIEYAFKGSEEGSWGAFGIVWEWATKQEWWNYFQDMVVGDTDVYENGEFTEYIDINLINPTNFAKAIYEYLKER